jgi:glucokinase
MEKDALYIGVDLGGTNIKAVVMTADGTRLSVMRRGSAAESGPDAVIDRMVSLIEEAGRVCEACNGNVLGLGISVPGIVDMERGLCRFLPNLTGWIDIPLVRRITERTGMHTSLINDVRAMTLAEKHFGAGRGVADLVCLALGTGIGGGIVLGGELYFGSEGLGCEIGHQIIEPQGPRCTCGSRGCLEALASGANIAFQAMRLIKQGATTLMRDMTGGDLNRITPRIVSDAARRGDPYAREIWNREAYYLGLGLANIVVVINPEMIILGGGVAEAFDLLAEGIRDTLRERVKLGHDIEGLRIVRAELKDMAGAMGAAAWAARV